MRSPGFADSARYAINDDVSHFVLHRRHQIDAELVLDVGDRCPESSCVYSVSAVSFFCLQRRPSVNDAAVAAVAAMPSFRAVRERCCR